MKDAVVLKSNKYGIQLRLNDEMPFEELKKEVIKKFNDSEKFFKDAQFAVTFDGRELTEDEECALVDAINSETKTNVLCIIEEDVIREEILKAHMEPEEPEEELLPELNPNSASHVSAEIFVICPLTVGE